ncbi:MAG: PEP-CTERM sorting domain-containing protein [Planctomycetaceae bacterium]|nr:PEP-CTERM sorting domain-containing protein [Planctomycetaceae bacterium]
MRLNYGGFVSSLLLCLYSVTMAQGNYSVLVQESPAGAGEMRPGIGVHSYGVSETVTVSTVAKTGYKFVTWLGDVSDPSANRTQLTVDGPKIVIAVFERDQYAFAATDYPQVSVGPESLYPRSDTYTNSVSTMDEPPDTPDNPDDPYTPDDPVPEPLTVTLLGLGATYLWRKRLFN